MDKGAIRQEGANASMAIPPVPYLFKAHRAYIDANAREAAMTTVLMNLRDVPEEEAQEVRELLEKHRILFYETPPSRWGISMGAIWLSDKRQEKEARQLIAQYQRKRRAKIRANHERLKREGSAETLLDNIRNRPFKVLLYLVAAALILYFSIRPFFSLGN
ncbi:hypothetical protein NB231_04067 [Nitrococcus mobilis Nb-231]|uniref:Uncharacterized protein n=2 Tax=Nitrococcus mobilis TaxID=35797 RepID=A4BTV8_9GAMM|nr:hypothetical protein NB231_04067 [Nitrococcus mobilis Nb-231]